MLNRLAVIVCLFFIGFSSQPFADTAPAAPAKTMTAEQFLSSLKFQHGKIELPDGIASLDLPSTFRYLPPDDAEHVLVDAWGNPPGNKTLGMIFPADVSPLSQESWGVVITYDKDGHVKDDDANSIDYEDLLKSMKESMQKGNEERKKQGYAALDLVGWAEKPTYDAAKHKLYWAKELAVENAPEHTLNYNIRVLGREGVLVLNAVAGMNQMGAIKTEMQKVVAFTNFNAGNSYADFDSKTDHVAEYGIAALVAGGVAAKLGLFAKLFALLLAFKKAIILGVIAVVAGIKKFFGRDKTVT